MIVVIEVREPEEKPGLDRPGFSHAQRSAHPSPLGCSRPAYVS